jgi:hypothetical protein
MPIRSVAIPAIVATPATPRRWPAEREALRLSGAGIVRWIAKGAMVTMDYRPDRLDLRLDGKGRIVKVECG